MKTPCWWIPEPWVVAFLPVIGLWGATFIPVTSSTSLDSSVNWLSSNWLIPNSIHNAGTTSSVAAIPALSPRPFTDVDTVDAPASTAAMEFAKANPISLWQCISIGMSITFFTSLTRYAIPLGLMHPRVSTILALSAPASSAVLKAFFKKFKSFSLVESSALYMTNNP